MAKLTRRGLLTGGWRNATPAIRPPWSGDESHFLLDCTRCDLCITSCGERVLRRGKSGYPEIDFTRGECTFCYACAEACPQKLFAARETQPWSLSLRLADTCLAWHQVECRSCEDACEPQAIRFLPSMQGVSRPKLSLSVCNGCGACVAGCPASAITLRPQDAH
ncbi:ferredoxin-type protein NapF [Cedecea sp. FDAARGOS_727]|uniref:ferredoxin-type protein NapF n=1 Tax=Cedecea sp. FDAARGOS_727 TaxID=2545798 RepID=UPI00143E1CCF|nr:ferredoxin-type protein NapF [Cedecea sp. FDAARGOS_727]QIX96855.1 ferredoxin-type protein NapF [Cedecea sp. FDAARGOS_727]